MTTQKLRTAACRTLDAALEHRCRWRSPEVLGVPTLVIAPHPDDETLGCGGTVASLTKRGIPVEIVVLTDGAGSHPGQIAHEQLALRRRNEVLRAAAMLGVPSGCVHQLGLPDGRAHEFVMKGVAGVEQILRELAPKQLIVPFAVGEHPDHIAANVIARRAVRSSGCNVAALEYPVWFWRHWPFVETETKWPAFKTASRRLWGMRALAALNAAVDVRAQLGVKADALYEHQTQMVRPSGNVGWKTLSDVCNGTFIDRFFTGFELFRASEWQ